MVRRKRGLVGPKRRASRLWLVDSLVGLGQTKQMPKLAIFILLFIALSPLDLGAKEVALTFDDCPMPDGHYYTGMERTRELVRKLRKLKVRGVAFFCNTQNLDSVGKKRLRLYSADGHVIANHTATHPDFHKLNTAQYISEIETAHRALRSFPTLRKWFRFPFLREGETTQKRDALRQYLARQNYLNAYVTIDTYDWYMNSLFQDALAAGRKIDLSKLSDTYVKVLSEGADFYDSIAVRVLKRSPKHVILLHENDLAALYIDSLVNKLRADGWKIIPAREAYQDPISKVAPDTLLLGQGRVVAMARAAGDKGPFWKWEDEQELERLFEAEKIFR